MKSNQCIATLMLSLMFAGHSYAAADVNRGAKVFAEECAECHSVKDGKNKKGPFLWGISGRKSGSIEDFKYSDSMKASGITWTADKIAAYIAAPKKIVPGGIMKYDGLVDEKDRLDVIEYLGSLH